MAVMTALFDAFNGSTLDTGKWQTAGTAPTVASGEARLVGASSNNIASATNYLRSVSYYDLTSSEYIVKWRKTSSALFYIQFNNSANSNALVLYQTSQTNMRFAVLSGGSLSAVINASFTADATANYWRVTANSSGEFTASYSFDGTSWTDLGLITGGDSGVPSNSIKPAHWVGGANTQYVYIDAVNPKYAPQFKTISAPVITSSNIFVAVPNILLPALKTITVPAVSASNGYIALPTVRFNRTISIPAIAPSVSDVLPLSGFYIGSRNIVIQVPEITTEEPWFPYVDLKSYTETKITMGIAKGELAQLKWNREQYDPIGKFRMEIINTGKALALPWGPPETFKTISTPVIVTELNYLKWVSDPAISGKIKVPTAYAKGAYVSPHGPARDLPVGLPMIDPAYTWFKWNNQDPGKPDPSKEKFKVFVMPRISTRLISVYPLPVKNGSLKYVLGILSSGTALARVYPPVIHRTELKTGDPYFMEITLSTAGVDTEVRTLPTFDLGVYSNLLRVGASYHDMYIDIETQRVTT